MSWPDVGLVVLRVVLGGIYLAHGARKMGWIGDGQFGDFTASIARRGFRPPRAWAVAAVSAEIIGGGLVVIGLATPFGAALLVSQSVTIAALVANRGFWHSDGGVEYPLALGAAATAIVLIGAGAVSVDALLGIDYPMGLAGLLIAVAVAGGLLSLLTRRSSTTSAGAGGAPPGAVHDRPDR